MPRKKKTSTLSFTTMFEDVPRPAPAPDPSTLRKLTVRIDRELARLAKIRGAEEGRDLQDIVAAALTSYLTPTPKTAKKAAR